MFSREQIDITRTAFDIDGVVTDTMGSFIRVAREEFGVEGIKKEDITSYWLETCLPLPDDIIDAVISRILDDPFGTGLAFNPGARGTLEWIAERSRLLFVTARPSGEVIGRWLETTLAGVDSDRIKVIATGNHGAKFDVLQEEGISFFVEDHLETCQGLSARGICGIVFDQPWNRHGEACMRIESWDVLRNFLEQIV
jgi:uncharacterized HAD superfamily protein